MSMIDIKSISFRKLKKSDSELLKSWFNKSHVKEFWDNSSEMWENVESYLNGHKILYDYWIGFFDKDPFCLIITSDASENDPNAPGSDNCFLPWIEPQGKTWTIDFMIGEESFLGRGLSYQALCKFTEEQKEVSAFLIDPELSNTKAIHVYQKAGFEKVGSFIPKTGYFSGLEHAVMKKKIEQESFYTLSNENLKDFLSMAQALWPDRSREYLDKELERILQSPNETGFICKKGSETIGFIIMSLRFDYVPKARKKPVGYIEGIYIKEEHRKGGIARKLCTLAEAWAKSKGCIQMGSDAETWNQDSILFHERLGFKSVENVVHFIKDI